jgi:cell fate (sporulation/competence/biofilm development) regulator YmcA (YheA/YmcA/DUF963 family)
MHIIIYKTDVATQTQASTLYPLLNALPPVQQYNFDLEDCDHILRVVSTEAETHAVCQLLNTQGFNCETMEAFVYQP